MKVFKKIKALAIALKQDVLMLWFAIKNPQTPLAPKLISGLAVAYALSPIDLIPDFIPVLGYVDELIILPALIWLAIRFIPVAIIQQSRIEAEKWRIQSSQKLIGFLGAAVIVLIWIIVVTWIYRSF
ncbi:YkvA family protein [Zwartia sp.]|uniref:YkvA family protein n=1 Tax=Zwartia sp. TaxID=2978004 RepID=UPI002717FF36|nr:YkvA family protein [Zwartia sp.]MDO9023126.1 YkvA family protein [Zwartia sp.]